MDWSVKSHYYSQHAVALRGELGRAISRQQMRELHEKVALRHFAVTVRQFAILALATWGLIRFDNPLIWVPLALVQGFTIFNFTVLLHEVVHHTIFARRHPLAERLLGFLYAVPSGISASQFTRWHLDHHAELGSDEDDPKRRAPVAEGERALVQAAVLHAGAVSDLFPRRAPGSVDLSG